ncbi:peptidase M10A [Actinokineospora globicatena]|uniref:peptidase M10A n=1 Tax=Actinokineospora globicatena TaxID=103729 RepID=UPI0020A3FE3F|nr:peptidase M10A [Actinokineospora globicatena]MCP2306726.1 hypothetical protein [Actinokineospora globicatena]GLW82157.1 hypothetical protein Aglo01_66380 [Actinokineospora globicatena]GLW88950.1 hypothetical protein Aglo02_65890 [Actinokineospora globicatena]
MGRNRITALVATTVAASAVVVAQLPVSTATADDRLYVVAEAFTFDEAGIPGGDANATTTAKAAADTSCSDGTYALKTWKVGTLTWLYNSAGVPATIASTALNTITTSTNTVAKGTNRCDLANLTTSTYTYGGTTTLKPQVSSNGSCSGNDGKSVTGWGALPTKVLAYTCTFYNARGVVVASDTLIDNVAYTWFTTKPANCTGAQYDLETTLTHERLHTAGLGHVDQARNAAQTMTPASSPCDTSRRLLGAGDYAGLKALASK